MRPDHLPDGHRAAGHRRFEPLKHVLIWILRGYRFLISPLYGQVCRYHPSCSAYALDAVTRFGAVRGSWLAARRIGRCHPWAAGGLDPVPLMFSWRTSMSAYVSEELE